MGSTRQQDSLLGGGISLPQWMKGRSDNRFHVDDTTFSPPSHDDSFFYIRYPKTQGRLSALQDFRPISEVFDEQNIASSTSNIKVHETQQQQQQKQQQQQQQPQQQQQQQQLLLLNQGVADEQKRNQVIDFSKHPLPCQPFVPSSVTIKENEVKPNPKTPIIENTKVSKSQGIDDGFHGEPALCGKSIVLVASQMMSNKFHETFSAEQANNQLKKGSKSLPATPLTSPAGSPSSSPKLRRRTPANRYFTGPFLPDREKYQSGWILASILGQSREIVTAKIDEEDETNTDISAAPPRMLNRKKSISSQNLTYLGNDEKASEKTAINANVFQAKPSELREMNCWSPTSM